VGGLLAIPISVVLGRGNVALPIVLGGILLILLAAFLAATMSEEGFTPIPGEVRTTWGMMLKTVQHTRQLGHRQPILLALLGIGLYHSLYSEVFDRLGTAHLLRSHSAPIVDAAEPVLWFGMVRAVAVILSLVTTEITRRRVDSDPAVPIARALLGSARA
jgi:DHA3 family tetracycline resistance protein-like MFS transporter